MWFVEPTRAVHTEIRRPGPPSEVRTGTLRGALRKLPNLIELLPSGELLGEEGCLDAVEEALEPADELRLRHTELTLRRDLPVLEGQRQDAQFVLEIGRQ